MVLPSSQVEHVDFGTTRVNVTVPIKEFNCFLIGVHSNDGNAKSTYGCDIACSRSTMNTQKETPRPEEPHPSVIEFAGTTYTPASQQNL